MLKSNKSINKKETHFTIRISFCALIFTIIFNFFLPFLYKIKINKYYHKRIKYINSLNRNYNESNLITFEDKLNWLVIHDTNLLKGKCSDKILLHNYSKRKLGKDICNKILKIYHSEKEIDLNELPNQFVLKTNHGSGFNIIVEDKKKFNLQKAKKILKKWMKIDYGVKGAEFHYSFINKKIFVEKYIGKSLQNYKFLCYNGKPKYVYVSIKEGKKKYRNFYDMKWKFLPFHCLSEPHPKYHYPKPNLFKLMKKYAIILSKDFKFVRVDLYELDNEVKLGELTFIPMNSFFYCKNKTQEIELGKDIIIKNNNKF
jgi:hypothetical protein